MFSFFRIIKKRLTIKILLALTIGAATVMWVVIYLSISNQQKQIREIMTNFGREIKSMAYAGIKHPMAVGDSPSIEKQLLDIKGELQNTEIVICDFNQHIVFATHKGRIGTEVSQFTSSKETLAALTSLLKTGSQAKDNYFEENVDGNQYLITIHSINNEQECHHCHGTSRKVLGGILIRKSTDATYRAIAMLRNRTIFISIIGFGALITIIYFLLAKLVTRPVTELAARAEEFAQGNMSVSVPVKSEDSIGVLANSFNYMVRSIKDQIEFANSLKVAIADPLFIVDNNRVITFMNEACAQLIGYSKQETEGKLTCNEIFNSDICTNYCPLKNSSKSQELVKGLRTTISNRAGAQIPIMTSASALKDAHGSIIGAVEICKDITVVLEAERLRYIKETAKKEEEQRKYLEARAENLLGTLSQVSDGNLKVRAVYSQGNEVMDKIAQHANHMLDNLEKLYEKISSFSKELELEVARRTMMLRERTILLERANRELRELDRLKSSFLANMSHELRTPMNSIIGYTDLLLDRVDGEINEEQTKSLQKVANNAKHLLQLINDILDMSKIEAGKVELAVRETDIKELIESITATFEPAINLKGLFLKFDYAEDLPHVFIDDDKTRQIFNNLLSNAIKFTNKGGITIHVKPSERLIKKGEKPFFVEICVEDTGIGILKEDIGKLFDKFSQLDVSASRQYEGTGLGLSIARGLVVLHKGVIWTESEYGKGTRLCFTLPAQKEIMEKPAEPIIEPIMAEKLGQLLNKPPELFLRDPSYGGKPIKCWEYTHCGQTSCPAYGGKERRCWLISGTHCKGIEIAKCPEKAEFCKVCEIIEHLVLEEYSSRSPERTNLHMDTTEVSDKKTVLAVDDNADVIELIKKNISQDYKVIGLLSSDKVVEKAKEIRPVAITLDIMMPGKNGWQVLQDLKRNPATQDIPVIIISIVDKKKMGFSLGAAEYIVKPIDKNTLLRKLKNLEKISRIQNILIIDNETDTVDSINQLLKKQGYYTSTAHTYNEAIQSLSVQEPDLIILNLIMTGADGADIIEHIKTENNLKKVPLILITHKDLDEEDINKLDGQIKAILNKSVLPENILLEELKNTINSL